MTETQEAEKIDGHVQYSGGKWSFFTTHQPALTCEFEDHRTCNERSEALMATADENAKADIRKIVENQKAEVDKQAAIAGDKAEKDILVEAGRRKHEQSRQNSIDREAALNDATTKAVTTKTAAKAAYEDALSRMTSTLEDETNQALAAWKEKQDEINAVNYLEEVKAERK